MFQTALLSIIAGLLVLIYLCLWRAAQELIEMNGRAKTDDIEQILLLRGIKGLLTEHVDKE